MNRVVIYTSKTGFTETYAKWIAEELKCNAKPLSEIDVTTLGTYDQVIYGGWVMASNISGLDKIVGLNIKELIVFGCGMLVPSDSCMASLLKQNNVEADHLFYFEGGYNPKKSGVFGKIVLKMVASSLKKKEDKSEDDLRMLETAKGADRTDREAIIPLIRYANR